MFDKSKHRKRATLDAREFEEALKQMAVLKRLPYNELISRAMRISRPGRSTARRDSTRSAKSSRRGSRKGSKKQSLKGSAAAAAAAAAPLASSKKRSGRAKGRLLSKVPGTGDFGVFEKTTTIRGARGAKGDYRRELEEIYSQHAPERLKNINALLSKYRGREDKLLAMVRKKYGDS